MLRWATALPGRADAEVDRVDVPAGRSSSSPSCRVVARSWSSATGSSRASWSSAASSVSASVVPDEEDDPDDVPPDANSVTPVLDDADEADELGGVRGRRGRGRGGGRALRARPRLAALSNGSRVRLVGVGPRRWRTPLPCCWMTPRGGRRPAGRPAARRCPPLRVAVQHERHGDDRRDDHDGERPQPALDEVTSQRSHPVASVLAAVAPATLVDGCGELDAQLGRISCVVHRGHGDGADPDQRPVARSCAVRDGDERVEVVDQPVERLISAVEGERHGYGITPVSGWPSWSRGGRRRRRRRGRRGVADVGAVTAVGVPLRVTFCMTT